MCRGNSWLLGRCPPKKEIWVMWGYLTNSFIPIAGEPISLFTFTHNSVA